ncbi:hypothetical protein ABPG73_007825 [Tetrahymena malaccensis]
MIFEAKMDNQVVIVKCLQLLNEEQIIEEMRILEQIKHIPNICEAIKGFQSSCGSRYYQIFKKYSCDLSNVMQYLFDQKKTLPLNSIVGIALLVSQVILSLPNMIHSDLKPKNILYDKLQQNFVLSDFGIAKKITEGSFTKNYNGADDKYRAPEYTLDELVLRKKYDVFCLGLIVLEMTLGRFLTNQETIEVRKGNLDGFLSKKPIYNDLNNIIKYMLVVDQDQRISTEQLVQLLNELKQGIENQFCNSLLAKIEDNISPCMINKFKYSYKQSFVRFDFDFKVDENRMDSYKFARKNQLNQMKDSLSKRYVQILDLDFELNISKKFEPPIDIFENIKQQFEGKNLIFPPKILSSIYDELQEMNIYLTSFLAQGGQGMIFEAKMDNQVVIVKCLQLLNESQIKDEISILEQIKHIPNICEFIQGIQSSCGSRYYQIFKKYSCDLSNVMQYLFDQKKTLPLNSIVGIALLVSQVILSLPNMVHSDLKPKNILYDKLQQNFVLSDFGVAKKITEGSFTKNYNGADDKYRAPEYTLDELVLRKKYDVFCLGLIVLEMTLGRFLSKQEAIEVRKGNLDDFLSKKPLYSDLNNIIKQMLVVNQDLRISTEQLVQSLNELKQSIENQFCNSVLTKIEETVFPCMIQKFKYSYKQSFVRFDFDFKVEENRMDSYKFVGKNQLNQMKDLLSKRYVQILDLDFEINDLKKFEAPIEIFEKIKKQLEGKNLIFQPKILSSIYDELQEKNIYLTSFLAQGGQGMIFEAKMNNQVVIIKCIQILNEAQIKEEMNIMEQIKHIPNICEIIEGMQSPCGSRYYQIFKKYSCDLSNVMQCLFDQKKTLPLNSIVGIALLVSQVILRLPNMVHSDLKPKNILYDKLQKNFVLSDFGAAKKITEGSFTKNQIGADYKYRDPELTLDELILRKKYDIFCLGLIVLEMTLGRFLTCLEAIEIRKGNLEGLLSKKPLYNELNNIIKQMLVVNQDLRISTEKLVQLLNELKQSIENQFCNSVLANIEETISPYTINQLKYSYQQSFLIFEFDFKLEENRMDSYEFVGKNQLNQIKDCLSKRYVQILDLDFEDNQLNKQFKEQFIVTMKKQFEHISLDGIIL